MMDSFGDLIIYNPDFLEMLEPWGWLFVIAVIGVCVAKAGNYLKDWRPK